MADACAAIQRLVLLARRLVRSDPGPARPYLSTASFQESPLLRVARLRDELHVAANRVARFEVDDDPIIDPEPTLAATVAGAALTPGRLIVQVEMTASRLMALLDRLAADDWTRTGRVGDGVVTLGDLVDAVVDEAARDLSDRLQRSGSPPPPVEEAG
jgi:hypothetical protein